MLEAKDFAKESEQYMMDITKKWTGHRQDWGQIHSQLEIYFEEHLCGKNL